MYDLVCSRKYVGGGQEKCNLLVAQPVAAGRGLYKEGNIMGWNFGENQALKASLPICCNKRNKRLVIDQASGHK